MQASTNFRGILFMCLAMVTFSCNDALVKSVTGAMNVGQIIFVRGLLTTLMVVLAAWHFRAFRPIGTLMRPVILFSIVMGTIWAFQLFDTVFVLTNGGPVYSTATIVWYIYNHAFRYGQVGMAAAMGVVLLLIIVPISYIQMRVLGERS